MTAISHLMLVTAACDGEWSQSETGNADILNEYLRTHYQGEFLKRVDEHGGGRNRMQVDVFIGTVNYLDEDKLLEVFKQISWDKAGEVELFIKSYSDKQFRIFHPK